METNYPFSKLFREKLVPMMGLGHSVEISGNTFEYNAESNGYTMTHNSMQIGEFNDPYDLMMYMARLVDSASPGSTIMLDSTCYMRCSDVDAWYPDLYCSNDGYRFQAWDPQCGGCC